MVSRQGFERTQSGLIEGIISASPGETEKSRQKPQDGR
jgi:hypothetical protein